MKVIVKKHEPFVTAEGVYVDAFFEKCIEDSDWVTDPDEECVPAPEGKPYHGWIMVQAYVPQVMPAD
ncbi:MAG: hypothetical protein Q7U52_11840 [Hydrogenophaga sp.]|nr:hypothetical protein [Hydrogenophaga sp.]